MKVFVAGATGVLGVGTVRALVQGGHDVVALSRSEANDHTIRALGARPARADLFDARSLAKAATGCEVVVRAATHIPKGKGTPEDWALNDRIRREGTRALLDAAKAVGARRYVQESIVWVARPADGRPFDERSPLAPQPITQSAVDAERMAATSGIPAATLRFGFFYGPRTAHMQGFVEALRKRRLPVIGDGRAPISFVHVDDAGRAMALAATRDVTGPYHVVDDRPTPVGDFFDTLAREIGAPQPMRIPVWLGKIGAGRYVAQLLTTPMVTAHDAFTQATGWRPTFATTHEGLRDTARVLASST